MIGWLAFNCTLVSDFMWYLKNNIVLRRESYLNGKPSFLRAFHLFDVVTECGKCYHGVIFMENYIVFDFSGNNHLYSGTLMKVMSGTAVHILYLIFDVHFGF